MWKDKFINQFEASISKIENYLNSDQPDIVEFTKLILSSNRHDFLPSNWAELYCIQDYVDLLDVMWKSIYDTGAICFLAINDKPKIIFENKDSVMVTIKPSNETIYKIEFLNSLHEFLLQQAHNE